MATVAVVEGEESGEQKALTLKTDKAFTTYFRSLDQGGTTVRFFDRKTFFSVHGKDAVAVADSFFKSRHALRFWDKTAGGLPLEYVPVRAGVEFQAVVRMLLVDLKQSVEVLECKGGGPRGWEVVKRASPGNVDQFDEVLDSMGKEPPVAVAISLGSSQGAKVVGIAFAETSLMSLGVMEFADDDSLSNLECALMQLGARECFIVEANPEKDRTAKKALSVLQKCGIPTTQCKRADFSRKDIEQDLGHLVGTVVNNLPELDQKYAMDALSCIIKKLDLLQTATSGQRYKLRNVDLTRYVKLDFAALRALNIVPGPGEGSNSMNLFNLLDKCKTAMGSRRLLRWVKQPLVDVNEINKRLDLVEEFVTATELRQSLRDECVRGIADLDRLVKKLASDRASLQDCVVLYDSAEKLGPIVRLLEEHIGLHGDSLKVAFASPLRFQMQKLEKFKSMVEQLVDLDKAAKEHVYEISTSWDPQLKELEGKRTRIRNKMEKMALQASTDIGVKQVKLVDTAQWGFVLRITKSDEKKLRDHSKRYTPLDKKGAGTTAGGAGIRFTCKELEDLNASLRTETENYEQFTKDLVARVLEVARSYLSLVEQTSDTVADLDALLSIAHVSASRAYVRPALHACGTGDTVLLDCRHPCVEAAAVAGPAGSAVAPNGGFIPNDISLVRGRSQFVIVTGPNMGGKSTYIRQAGVAVVMAQMGCFVPAREASVSAVDSVMCRVGAGDSQLRGVSTFMSEMLETAAILRSATSKSLIIIDELGRGTSTYDGFGLAWAISEYICKTVGCLGLFATHFHELTALEDKLPFVKNLHVTAQTVAGRLVLQYKVRDGACDRSFGIHVAELADFPQAVVDVAKRKAAELEDFRPKKRKEVGEAAAGSITSPAQTPTPAATPAPVAADAETEERVKAEIGVFMRRFAEIPMDTLSDEDAIARSKDLAEEFLKTASPEARQLLDTTI